MTNDPHSLLELGAKYTKKELAELLDQRVIGLVREGIYYCNNSKDTLLFVDLEKEGKEARFHFNDFFAGEYFHWDSQTTQRISSPKIVEITDHAVRPLLFIRRIQKINSKTQPFVYAGRLEYVEYQQGTEKPVHLTFRSLDYDDHTQDDGLIDLYLWKPEMAGRTSSVPKIERPVSEDRKTNYTKPDKTERSGLITSRVGQGYYRQQVLEKWNGVCAVTGCRIRKILIASHIVPWSESNDHERLDPNNGILLSPDIDALFDRNLISFNEDGTLIRSSAVSAGDLDTLGIPKDATVRIDAGMEKYLKRHRAQLA